MDRKEKPTAKQILTGLLVIGLLTLGAVGLAWSVWRAFHTFAPQVNSTVIAAVSTAIGSALTLVFTKRWDRRWEIEQQHRAAKIPVYEQFMQFLFRVFLGSKEGGTPVPEAEMMEFIVGFTQKLIVWGSDDVLRKYGVFRQTLTGENQGLKLMYNLEKLLYAIRSDIGHSNKDLKQGSLLKLFINDLPGELSPED